MLYLQGQALPGVGQEDAARTCWLEAKTTAEAAGSRQSLWRILYALSQLEDSPVEAENLRQQAQAVVEYIAAHISDEHADLRRSFLDQPDVRAILNGDRGGV